MARIQLFKVASNPKQGKKKSKMSPAKKAELVKRLQAGKKKAARKAGKKAVKKNPQTVVYSKKVMSGKGKKKKSKKVEVRGKTYPTANEMTLAITRLAQANKQLASIKKGKGSLQKSMELTAKVASQNEKIKSLKKEIANRYVEKDGRKIPRELLAMKKQGFGVDRIEKSEDYDTKLHADEKNRISQSASEKRNKKRSKKQKRNKTAKKANKQQGVLTVAKKKKAAKKAGKKARKSVKKSAPKKVVARRKKARKSVSKAAPKKARSRKKARKGGNRKQVIHLRGKKSVMVKVLKNPSVKGLTGQDSMMELAGLAIGGAGYNLFNDLGKKYLPASVANIIAKAGPVSGAVIPTLVGFGLLKLAEKKGMKKTQGIAKGIIAAAIVAVGASIYEVAARKYVVGGTLPAPMKGYDDEDMGQVSYDDFGATSQDDFGAVSSEDFGSDESEFAEGDFTEEFN
jgi:hypothetical protein